MNPLPPIAIRAGQLIDGISPEPLPDVVILIEGDRISCVGGCSVPPIGSQVIDLAAYTVLPGLIDSHTHMCFAPGDGKNPVLTKSIPFRALQGAAASRATLHAGFTTARDMDSEGAGYADVAVRDAIRDGLIPGPRLFVSTMALSITGGHMNHVGLAPEIDSRLPQFAAIADTTDEMIRAVRQQVKYGADWIKVYVTSNLKQVGPTTLEPVSQFSAAQLSAVVAEARRWRRDVAVHAYGGEGAKDAVRAGVRSIEHGILLDEEALRLMAERGVYWCPTFANMRPTHALAGYSDDFVRRVMASHREVFRKALALGVKIVFGTDAGRVVAGTNAEEFDLMVQAGMEPMRAIQAATSVAAELLRLDDQIGAVRPGYRADLIAVAGNPLDDVKVLQDVRFVMKAGAIVKQPGGSAGSLFSARVPESRALCVQEQV
jgi:imidazolonepropionase-like amidohydrolase